MKLLTNSRSPEDLDIAIGLEPEAVLAPSEKPHASPVCSFAQHLLVDLPKIGD
jgi:hypothetical protein